MSGRGEVLWALLPVEIGARTDVYARWLWDWVLELHRMMRSLFDFSFCCPPGLQVSGLVPHVRLSGTYRIEAWLGRALVVTLVFKIGIEDFCRFRHLRDRSCLR